MYGIRGCSSVWSSRYIFKLYIHSTTAKNSSTGDTEWKEMIWHLRQILSSKGSLKINDQQGTNLHFKINKKELQQALKNIKADFPLLGMFPYVSYSIFLSPNSGVSSNPVGARLDTPNLFLLCIKQNTFLNHSVPTKQETEQIIVYANLYLLLKSTVTWKYPVTSLIMYSICLPG